MVQRKDKFERDFIQQRQIVPFERKSHLVRPEDISWAGMITNLVINVGLAFTMIELAPKCTKRYSAWQGNEYLMWDEDVYDFARPWAMSKQVRNKHICQRLRVCLSRDGFQMPKRLKVDVKAVPIVYDEMVSRSFTFFLHFSYSCVLTRLGIPTRHPGFMPSYPSCAHKAERFNKQFTSFASS